MPVFIAEDYYGPFWSKFELTTCDEADDERIAAGKKYLKDAEMQFIMEDVARAGDRKFEFITVEIEWPEEYLPRKLQLSQGTALPDYIHSYRGGSNGHNHSALLSEKAMETIDQTKSGSDNWKFHEIKIEDPAGKEVARYFAWLITTRRDAVDALSPGVKSVGGPIDGKHLFEYSGERSPENLRLKKDEVKDLNAWTDFRFYGNYGIFVSDEVFQKMTEASLSGFAAQSTWSVV
ncbi:hypothetical protein [Tateyamaria sp. ANG-S1]|uniref:hypothetical protein n=1 Tax=Tateyamaria sp. ANG-S1 TaxID=1577905 RepID=UPI00057E2478|nr:hypothetical protein [Tateyamaria sp. ANG-S1]KIC51741.1 hypothetical protein RA29_00010 [Tateyamaria sp. ANG-S1]